MSEKEKNHECTLDQVRAAKLTAQRTFGRLAKVVGIGITRVGKGYGLKVNLQHAPDTNVLLPENIQGVPIQIEVVGTIGKRAAA